MIFHDCNQFCKSKGNAEQTEKPINKIKNIDKVLKKAKEPFTAIIGGSKISTKIHIIEALIEKVDNLIVGGGIVFTFIKAMGGKVGASLIEDDYIR